MKKRKKKINHRAESYVLDVLSYCENHMFVNDIHTAWSADYRSLIQMVILKLSFARICVYSLTLQIRRKN